MSVILLAFGESLLAHSPLPPLCSLCPLPSPEKRTVVLGVDTGEPGRGERGNIWVSQGVEGKESRDWRRGSEEQIGSGG